MDSHLPVGASAVPPQHVLPALLPLSVIIHRQAALVVTLTHAEVYPSGCALFVSLRANVVTRDEQRFLNNLLTNFGQDDIGEFTVAIVRDGQRQLAEFLTVQDGGVFYRINVRGGGQHHRMSYWLSPLPTSSCTLQFHSPPLGIDMAQVGVDPAQLADAAQSRRTMARMDWRAPASRGGVSDGARRGWSSRSAMSSPLCLEEKEHSDANRRSGLNRVQSEKASGHWRRTAVSSQPVCSRLCARLADVSNARTTSAGSD